MLFAFFIVLTSAWAEQKQWWGKTSGSLAQIKAMVANCIGSHCILKYHLPKKMPVSLKNIINGGFCGGTVVKNLPASAGDTGSSPGLERSHMPWNN